MKLTMAVGLGPGDFVLDEDPAAPKMGAVPQFLAHVHCGPVSYTHLTLPTILRV